MLILLPPSEGKLAARTGAPVQLSALTYDAQLGAARAKVLAALVALSRRPPKAALAALGLSSGQAPELQRNAMLLEAPAAPAAEVYTGVLYQHLDLASLTPAARRRAGEQVRIASALWGVVALGDRIPAYRLSMSARLALGRPRRSLAAWWRPALTVALPDAEDDLVVDLRSGSYAAAWTPRHATRVEVRVVTAGGRPISHMSKATRGAVARRLLQTRRRPRTPQDVAAAAGGSAGRVELHPPVRPGAAWTVEVVAAPQ